jgi:hypothetical protein
VSVTVYASIMGASGLWVYDHMSLDGSTFPSRTLLDRADRGPSGHSADSFVCNSHYMEFAGLQRYKMRYWTLAHTFLTAVLSNATSKNHGSLFRA